MWQDYVISMGQIVFIIALIPSILSDNKPAMSTSFTTAAVLSTFVFCFASLGLIFAAITSGGSALAWWILFYQGKR